MKITRKRALCQITLTLTDTLILYDKNAKNKLSLNFILGPVVNKNTLKEVGPLEYKYYNATSTGTATSIEMQEFKNIIKQFKIINLQDINDVTEELEKLNKKTTYTKDEITNSVVKLNSFIKIVEMIQNDQQSTITKINFKGQEIEKAVNQDISKQSNLSSDQIEIELSDFSENIVKLLEQHICPLFPENMLIKSYELKVSSIINSTYDDDTKTYECNNLESRHREIAQVNLFGKNPSGVYYRGGQAKLNCTLFTTKGRTTTSKSISFPNPPLPSSCSKLINPKISYDRIQTGVLNFLKPPTLLTEPIFFELPKSHPRSSIEGILITFGFFSEKDGTFKCPTNVDIGEFISPKTKFSTVADVKTYAEKPTQIEKMSVSELLPLIETVNDISQQINNVSSTETNTNTNI